MYNSKGVGGGGVDRSYLIMGPVMRCIIMCAVYFVCMTQSTSHCAAAVQPLPRNNGHSVDEERT